MRFRYFDSEGTEVGLSSVDALRFRIQTGVVTPETLLYDAAAGQWAPARQNPLFRFLVEEDEDLLPEEHRDLMDGGKSSPSGAGKSGSAVRWSSPRADFDSDELDAAVNDDLGGLEAEPTATHEVEETSVPEDGLEVTQDHITDSDWASSPSEEDSDFPDLELSIPAVAWDRPEATGAGGSPEASSSEEGASAERDSIEEVRADGAPVDHASGSDRSFRHRSFPTPPREEDAASPWLTPDPGSTYRDSYSRHRRSRPSLAGVAALSILVVFAVGIPILVLGGGGAGSGGGTAYALVGSLAEDLVSDDEAGGEAGDDARVSGGSSTESRESTGSGPSPAALPSSSAPDRLSEEEMESLAVEVDAAASADIDDALANLRVALRVPQTPPADWLQGRYLAEATSFAGVERYWVAFASLVNSMEELEGELYRGFLQSRILGMRLDTADAARLSNLAFAMHEDRSEERGALYRDLDLLASHAIALHDTLVARSDDVADRAFDGTTLTRYPFMAAVPDDPVLAEHVWSRIDGILDVIRTLDGARPTSVTELRAAVRRVTPGGAGDPLDELPDWWPRPADRRATSPPPLVSSRSATDLDATAPASTGPGLPEPETLPVPTQEIVVPD